MATWTEDEWKSGDPVIDAEHQKLHQLISSMKAVVRNDPGLGLAAEAMDVLTDRLNIHFRMEEGLASRAASDESARLRDDHRRLLALLAPVRQALQAGNLDRAKQLLAEFHAELDRHDREIDIPLFRKIRATPA
jgi:hemerythrin-like metal-binding protein